MRRRHEGGATQVERVAPDDWRERCRAAAVHGRFCGLFAHPGEDGLVLRALFSHGGETLIIESVPVGGRADSIVDELPAAAWHEREIHDLEGLSFSGHEPLRPLLDHSAPLEDWTVPTTGNGVHQVAVGPTHAGIIESGHFRLHVVGDRILHCDLRLFYKRRGLERAAAGQTLEDGLAYVARACAACSVANSVAYAQACERLLGLEPPPELRRARTLLIELERVYNHLHDLSMICAGVGFAPGAMAYAALKERAQRTNESLSGHRFLFGSVAVGCNDLSVTRRAAHATQEQLRAIHADHAVLWRELQFVRSLQARLDVGTLTRDDALRLGTVGPAARAAGVAVDVRADSPLLEYAGFRAGAAAEATGDVAARMAVRAAELDQSFGLLDGLLERSLPAARARPANAESDIAAGRVEGARGENVVLVERAGDRIRALSVRTSSYANWPSVAHAVAGAPVPDFPLINKSFELCYACVDR